MRQAGMSILSSHEKQIYLHQYHANPALIRALQEICQFTDALRQFLSAPPRYMSVQACSAL